MMANGLRKLITGNVKQSLQCVIDGEEFGLVDAAKVEFELVEPERITEPERVCWHDFTAEFMGETDPMVMEVWALLFRQSKKQKWQQRREEKRRRWYERNLPKGARHRQRSTDGDGSR